MSDAEHTAAIVVGAGSGQRLGGVDKAFMPLAGRPLIAYSVALLESLPEIDAVCLVVSDQSVAKAEALARQLRWKKIIAVVPGGNSRQASVLAGLGAIGPSEWLLIHDAARPLLTAEVVRRGRGAVRRTGAAVAATPVRDTLKRVDAGEDSGAAPRVLETVDRSELWAAQTPQVFRTALLRDAFDRIGSDAGAFTDDAAVAQAAGYDVRVFPGDARNLKITLPEDIALAEVLLAAANHPSKSPARSPAEEHQSDVAGGVHPKSSVQSGFFQRGTFRIGTGYDVHRLVAGRPLVLGGVTVPAEVGLLGHSDADVLTHAVIDALFGACGLPDIGRHFPPGDPAYRNADSIDLLKTAVQICRESAWQAASVDSTVICERPKLAPHIDHMRQKLAGACGLLVECVNVKAKTNEGLDAIGRGEAIAAQAVILVENVRTDL
jgi:2-C-methyl-D-erythritol 4-phosphate cytidylyltransferase / 2-C-methyl-D-erythritol 2,4-cyclodiphosphate synthase